MLNIYNCPLYKMQCETREFYQNIIYQNNETLSELRNPFYKNSDIIEKANEQMDLNKKELDEYDQKITKFQHCKKCLLEANDDGK